MGDRQNLDNFIGDHSSTRTFHSNAQHHSKSSWSMGWGAEPAPAAKVSSNAFASGSNMNAGNVISDRSTTRLHAPPGGHTSDIFGTGAPSAAPAQRQTGRAAVPPAQQQQQQQQQRAPEPQMSNNNNNNNYTAQAASQQVAGSRSTSANAFASGSNMNAGNVITDRPTTRLHAPPGGYTNDIFGTGVPASRPAKTGKARPAPTPVVDERKMEQQSQQPAAAPIVDKTNLVASSTPAYSSSPVKRSNTSANAFASGSNMNAGNVLTDRPTTRVHAPPGGQSQIFFG